MNYLEITLLFVGLTTIQTGVDAQQWHWVKNYGQGGREGGEHVTTDKNLNLFVTGTFLDDFSIDNQPLQGSSIKDSFIAKYDSAGTCLWAKSSYGFEGNGVYATNPRGVITDSDGNVYSVGTFTNKIIFEDDTLINPACVAYCSTPYIVSYDNNGNYRWAKCFLDSENSFISDISIDQKNQLFLSGSFQRNLTLDSIQINGNYIGGFIIKMNQLGEYIWAKSMPGATSSVMCDTYQNIYVTGEFRGTAVFDTEEINAVANQSAGSVFIAKYNVEGNFCWVRGGEEQIVGRGSHLKIVEGEDDKLILAGMMNDSIKFDNVFVYGLDRSTKDFLVKFDSSGTFHWGHSVGGLSNEFGNSLVVNPLGEIYFSSSYTETASFGQFTLTSNGYEDIQFSKYNIDGDCIWVKGFGSANQDIPYDMNMSNIGEIYLTGTHHGSFYIENHYLLMNGNWDIFITKYSDSLFMNTTTVKNSFEIRQSFLYPNPADNELFVSGLSNHFTEYSIFNSLGNIKLKGKINIENNMINIDGLYSGVYLIKMPGSKIYKFIKN